MHLGGPVPNRSPTHFQGPRPVGVSILVSSINFTVLRRVPVRTVGDPSPPMGAAPTTGPVPRFEFRIHFKEASSPNRHPCLSAAPPIHSCPHPLRRPPTLALASSPTLPLRPVAPPPPLPCLSPLVSLAAAAPSRLTLPATKVPRWANGQLLPCRPGSGGSKAACGLRSSTSTRRCLPRAPVLAPAAL